MPDAPAIACGLAGWSYPDWEGRVYPRGVGDRLAYIAGFVDCIEINSTFYRPPVAAQAARWAAVVRDRPSFFFTAKLHRDFTHGPRAGAPAAAPLSSADFLAGLAPLRDAGRLRQLLAQFPHSFTDTPAARRHLDGLHAAFADAPPLALELRHGSWQTPPALAYLEALGLPLAHLDYPVGRDSFDLPLCTWGAHAYFRLHGRNHAAWTANAGRDAMYHYAYSNTELESIAQRAIAVARVSQSLTLIANNHYHGHAVAAALRLKARFTGAPLPVPPPLSAHDPALRDIAANPAPRQGALFEP